MKEIYIIFLAIGLALTTGTVKVASGQSGSSELLPLKQALGREFWSSPRFIRSFVGDYGFRTAIEPRVERKEQELLRKVVSQAQNDHPAAITILEEKVSRDSSAALDFTLATLHFQNGQLSRAAEGYRTAIEKFPGFLRSHKNLGLVLLQLGDYQNASEALLKSISLGENEGVSFVALGYCYLILEKFASAENAYRAAILREPDGQNAHNGLVNCLLETNRHEEAVAMLDELIQQQPDQAFYWRAQTNAYVELGKTREAAVNLEMFRRLDKLNAREHLLLADLYYNLQLHHLALSSYQAALTIRGDLDAGRFIRVARILVDRGSYTEGFDYLDRIVAKFKEGLSPNERLDLLALRARVAIARGQEEEADNYLATILKTNPHDGQALLLRGRYFWTKKKDSVEAEYYFKRAAKIEKFAAGALVEHAQMLVAGDKYAEAEKLLQRAQLINPRKNVERYLESIQNVMKVRGG